MPPRKKKKKTKTPKSMSQKQSQTQKVELNLNSQKTRSSGRKGLPPPSYTHNLAPVFVQQPQVDITSLRDVLRERIPSHPVTPLSSDLVKLSAQRSAGDAAIARAGKTASNFQSPPSQMSSFESRHDSMMRDFDDAERVAEEAFQDTRRILSPAFGETETPSPFIADRVRRGELPREVRMMPSFVNRAPHSRNFVEESTIAQRVKQRHNSNI